MGVSKKEMDMIHDLMHLLEEESLKMNLEGYCVNELKMVEDLEAKTEEEDDDEEEREEGSRVCICSISSSFVGGCLTLPTRRALPHLHSSSSNLQGDKRACMRQLYGTPPDQASGRRKRARKNEDERVNYADLVRGRGRGDEGCSVMRRAQEVQANLAIKFPSFVRVMLPSAVYRGFWVTLPKEFCQLHLPGHDTVVVLVGETDEKEYKINYLGHRRALSGGWKRFSQEHNLVAGDVLIFHLIRAFKFKVYIVRVNCLGEVDAALSLIDLHFHGKRGAYADGGGKKSVLLNAKFG